LTSGVTFIGNLECFAGYPALGPQRMAASTGAPLSFAIIADAYYTNTAPRATGGSNVGLLSALSRYFSLEFALLLSVLMIILGIGLEALLGLQQLDLIAPHEALASFGAFSTIVGLESFFSSFVTHLLSFEQKREHTRGAAASSPPAPAANTARRPHIPVSETAATTLSNSA